MISGFTKAGYNILTCKCGCAQKDAVDASEMKHIKHKARLVAAELHHIHVIDFDETPEPVIKHSMLRMLRAVFATKDYELF